MQIRTSQLRGYVADLRAGMAPADAAEKNFSNAYSFKGVDMAKVTLRPITGFAGTAGMGIEVFFDGVFVGTWRPGGGDRQEFYCDALAWTFALSVNSKTRLLEVEAVRE